MVLLSAEKETVTLAAVDEPVDRVGAMSDRIVSNLGCMDRSNPKFNWPWDEKPFFPVRVDPGIDMGTVVFEQNGKEVGRIFNVGRVPLPEEAEKMLQLRVAEYRMARVRERETSFAGAAGSGPDGVTG